MSERDASKDRVTIFQDINGEWRWTRRAPNHEVISTSAEGYKKQRHAMKMAKSLNPNTVIYIDQSGTRHGSAHGHA